MSGTLQSDGYADFIERLRGYRLQIGVTQEVLATRMGRPQSFISKTERRERRLDVMEFIEWATALEIEPGDLLKVLR